MTTQVSFHAAYGGLNQADSPWRVDPGEALLLYNHECSEDGYRRIDGYERFDGQTAPSSTTDPATAETYRTAITAVPGAGPVRGVWVYNGDVYAFRDNVGQTACVMHKATASGWTTVTTPALSPGGSYEFMNVNFYGTTDTHRMYGVDGVNKGFEFDGTTFSQITTGMTTDAPIHLAEHNNYLVYAFEKGSLQFSPIGEPGGTWTLKTGTASIGTGAAITALTRLTGNTLTVFCDEKIQILTGTSPTDFLLEDFSVDVGAVAGTVVPLNLTYFLGPRGLTTLEASQNYGDFESKTFSSKVKAQIGLIDRATAAAFAVRTKSQYRITWVSPGSSATDGITFTLANEGALGFSTFRYLFAMSCVCRGDIDDAERIFCGSDDGYVYEIDSGPSFDGVAVEAYLTFPFNTLKSPRHRKRFRKLIAEVSSPEAITVRLAERFEYNDPEYPASGSYDADITGSGGYWNVDDWNQFLWASGSISRAEMKIAGTGKNISLHLYTNCTYEQPYTIHGLAVQYDIRRLER